jgi:spoIIIJ-associated protein
MIQVEKTGRTVDEAIAAALRELGVSAEETDIEIIEEATKGILGIFSGKQAKVLVRVKEEKMELAAGVTEFLQRVLGEMELETHLEVIDEDGGYRVNISGEGLGLIIGKRGQTLEALQYLTNIVANRYSEKRIRVVLDAEGYRKRREEVLQQLAERLASRVERSGDAIMLEPMSAHERKIIHTALQDNPMVTTRSEGEEPNRKVVIHVKD